MNEANLKYERDATAFEPAQTRNSTIPAVLGNRRDDRDRAVVRPDGRCSVKRSGLGEVPTMDEPGAGWRLDFGGRDRSAKPTHRVCGDPGQRSLQKRRW